MKRKDGLTAVVRGAAARALPLTIGLGVCIAVSVLLALLPPLVLERIVDSLTAGGGVQLAMAVFYFAALALSGIVDSAKELLIAAFGQKITHAVRSRMCAKLSRLPASYFAENDPGATASRFVNDVDTVEELFASGVISMFADACRVVGILAVIFVKSRGLGLLMLAATPLLFGVTRLFQKRMLAAQLQNRAAVARVSHWLPETMQNIRMIHTLGKEGYMERRYDEAVQQSYRALERSNFYDSIYSPIILTVSAVLVGILMTGAASGGAAQRFFGMTVGTAVAMVAYVGKVFSPLESIGMEIQSIQSAVAGVRRIGDFLDLPERAPADAALTAAALRAAPGPCVEFSGVSFAYDPGTPVLQNCSFAVQRGETVTFTGRTGAGKSTVFKLILGLYSPQAGSARVCGAAAAAIPDSQKRALFGYVEQQFRPVPGTVADQISLYDPGLTRGRLEQAARVAGLHPAIEALARGYDTPFAPQLFSQGQLQLLAIARAVAADPSILLLDEITANLDARTEETVLAALQSASRNRTVLSISHRLYEKNGGRQIALAD